MAAAVPTPLLRLLPLLLLLLPPGLREHLSPPKPQQHVAAGDGELVLHPIVMVPGVGCSKVEARLTEAYRPSVPRCGALKGKGWFGLWTNASDIPAHHYVQCFTEQMGLVYDPAADEYRNTPGVETRVPSFGSSQGFQWNPEHPDRCLKLLRHQLEGIGYRDGDTLFGAPYDLRHAPPAAPGQKSRAFSRYFGRLAKLIEDASSKNQGKKVILFGHSFGGSAALEFVRGTTMDWRQKHIKHLILTSPVLAATGVVSTLKYLASGPEVIKVPTTTSLDMRPMWRTFESAIVNFPSPAVFGHMPVVVTERRNYSAHDMEEFLVNIGMGGAVQAFKRRKVTSLDGFQAPMVPTTCINGVGNDTPEQLVYWGSDFDAAPEIVYGDGDGTVNLISMLAFDEQMRRQPAQNKLFRSIKLAGAKHSAIVIDDWSLQRVMQEIHNANGISA